MAQGSRISRRTELLLGLALALAGALGALVVGPLVDIGWVRVAGVVVGVLGVFVVIGVLTPKRTAGTKMWQNDIPSGGFGGGV